MGSKGVSVGVGHDVKLLSRTTIYTLYLFLTRTSFFSQIGLTVVPVLGILYDMKAFSPSPNAAEVEAIFDAPIEMFLKVLLYFQFSLLYFILFDEINLKKFLSDISFIAIG